MCISFHQLNSAIVCFMYELVLEHDICTITCVCVATRKECQKTRKGVRLLQRVSKLFYSTPGVLVNISQELMNTLVSLNTPSSNLTPHF